MSDNLNVLVKSRLSQLSDLSYLKRRNYDDDKRVYIDSLKGYFNGQIFNSQPNGFGCV